MLRITEGETNIIEMEVLKSEFIFSYKSKGIIDKIRAHGQKIVNTNISTPVGAEQ
jgi:hypothetical protein